MQVQLSIDIPAPVEEVWAFAQDPAKRVLWDVRVADYQWLGPMGVGSEILITLRMGLLRPQARGRMLRWQPPRQSVVQVEQASSPLVPLGAGSWTFTPVEGGTNYTTRFTLKDEALPWYIPRGLFGLAVRWDTWRSLRRLRRLILKERTKVRRPT